MRGNLETDTGRQLEWEGGWKIMNCSPIYLMPVITKSSPSLWPSSLFFNLELFSFSEVRLWLTSNNFTLSDSCHIQYIFSMSGSTTWNRNLIIDIVHKTMQFSQFFQDNIPNMCLFSSSLSYLFLSTHFSLDLLCCV